LEIWAGCDVQYALCDDKLRQLAKPRHTYDENVKVDLGGVVYEVLDFISVQ
jgi:hypothetical protein